MGGHKSSWRLYHPGEENIFISHLPGSVPFISHKVNLCTRDSLNVSDIQKMQLIS